MASIGDERVLPVVAATWSGDADTDAGGEWPQVGRGSRYRELGLIGRGGLGEVLEVFDDDLQRKVALKRPRSGGVTPSVSRALVREAQVTAQLEHPGIPSVHALGIDAEERPFFTMERLEGVALSEILAQGPIRAAAGLRVWTSVAWAVAFAHDRGVVHRDLKPSNVIVGEFGQVHVVDWGIASRIGEPDPPRFSGTPAYAAPEQLAGGPVDPRMDVYALGALLYELLGGRPASTAATPADALEVARHGGIRKLSSLVPISTVLEEIVHRALAVRPEDRHASVVALIADVRAFEEGAAVTSAHEAPLSRLGRLYFARSKGLRRFRWVDVDLWMGSSMFFGIALALAAVSPWLPWLAGWAVGCAVASVGFFAPPVWTLLRPERPDERVADPGPGSRGGR